MYGTSNSLAGARTLIRSRISRRRSSSARIEVLREATLAIRPSASVACRCLTLVAVGSASPATPANGGVELGGQARPILGVEGVGDRRDPGDAVVEQVPEQPERRRPGADTRTISASAAPGRTSGTPGRPSRRRRSRPRAGSIPPSRRAPRRRAGSARASASNGSIATTSCPSASSSAVSFPVPAPRSSTRCGRSPMQNSIAARGYPGRPSSYASASAPKARARRPASPAVSPASP